MVCVALPIDAAFGYPDAVFRAVRHPVVWIGALISWLDRSYNRMEWSDAKRRAAGVLAISAMIMTTVLPAWAIQTMLSHGPGIVLIALMSSTLIAQRSLWTHVSAVAKALQVDGLPGGRRAVSMIVGRNPDALDEAGVVRAAIESLAENFSDGIVAPALWCAACGLPGLVFYKSVNTADSMIGHRTPRHEAFGWAAARLDDVINLPASRLSAVLLITAAVLNRRCPVDAARAVWRDATSHRSPNAGWPEAAMAGALGLRLAGPRTYGDVRVEDSWMGHGRADATVADLHRALRLYRTACALQFTGYALLLSFI